MNTIYYFSRKVHIQWLKFRCHQLKSFTLTNILIIAPHPDDEVLGCGGLITRLVNENRPPHIIILSGGEASHKGCCNLTSQEIISVRRNLTREALSILNVPQSNIHHLNFPDGSINRDSPEVSSLKDLISRLNPACVLVPHWGEGWPDHINVKNIVKDMVPKDSQIWEYCVWMWYYNVWRGLDWNNARAIHLSPQEQDLKRKAIDAYITPMAPCGSPWSGNLPPLFIKAHQGTEELYFKSSD